MIIIIPSVVTSRTTITSGPSNPLNSLLRVLQIWLLLCALGLYFLTYYPGKGSPYSITKRRVPGLIPVLGSQPAGDVSHKPGGRLPLLCARPAVTLATLKSTATNSLVGEQRYNGCKQFKNPGPSALESSTLTTRLLSHPYPGWSGNDPCIVYLPAVHV